MLNLIHLSDGAGNCSTRETHTWIRRSHCRENHVLKEVDTSHKEVVLSLIHEEAEGMGSDYWPATRLGNPNKIPESKRQGQGLGSLKGCTKLSMKQPSFSMFSYTRKPLVTTSAHGRGVTAWARSYCASFPHFSTGASDSDQSHHPHLAWLSGHHGNPLYLSQSHPRPSSADFSLTSVGVCSKI